MLKMVAIMIMMVMIPVTIDDSDNDNYIDVSTQQFGCVKCDLMTHMSRIIIGKVNSEHHSVII